MKTTVKYVIISLLLLLGLGCVGILYLFFIPNSSIFGITYINHNKTIETEKFESSDISQIKLISRGYPVRILETKKEEIHLTAHSNSFGFVKLENEHLSVKTQQTNNVLSFEIIEPHGFTLINESYISLYIPSTKSFDLNLKNQKSNITINNQNLKINNLACSTEKGNFSFSKGTLEGELNLNLRKGDFVLAKEVVSNENDVTLKLTSGSFTSKVDMLGDINIKSNKRGVINITNCEDIIEDSKSAGGQINVKSLKYANIKAGDTKISIGKASQSVNITLFKSGSVKIKEELLGESSIVTNSGKIIINKPNSALSLSSNSGNITVTQATLAINVSSNKGTVNIKFAEDAPTYTENTQARTLYAKIKNGKLIATGVEHIGDCSDNPDKGITVTGDGSVNIKMNEVYGHNYIDGRDGRISVVINKDSQYVLKTSSSNGGVRVNLAQIAEYNGYTTKTERTTYVNCVTSNNTLTVTTNYGRLTVLDTNFA